MGAGEAFVAGQGLSLFGSALEAGGLRAQASAAKTRGDYQAAILRQNAGVYREIAGDTIKRGQIQQQRQQTATSQFVGRQRVALAANGILVDEGSAVDLVRDTVRTGKTAENDIRFNAERAAYQNEIDAINAEADATLSQFTSQQQASALKLASLTTLLGGAGRTAASTAIFQQAGGRLPGLS